MTAFLNEEFTFYEDAFAYLNKKFNVTYEEMQWWSNDDDGSTLECYISDIPLWDCVVSYIFEVIPNKRANNFIFDVKYGFYRKKDIESFVPSPFDRLISQKDLQQQRNWSDPLEVLEKAAKLGVLSFYRPDMNDFSRYKFKNDGERINICDTEWGENYLTQSNSLFILSEIIIIERMFFKIPRERGIEELWGEST